MRVSVCKSVSSEFVVCLAINEIRRIGYFLWTDRYVCVISGFDSRENEQTQIRREIKKSADATFRPILGLHGWIVNSSRKTLFICFSK